MSAAAAAEIDVLRKAWKDANLAPLWENKFAHRPAPPPEATYLWSWEKIRPLIAGAIKVPSVAVSWGLRALDVIEAAKPDHLVHTPAELGALF